MLSLLSSSPALASISCCSFLTAFLPAFAFFSFSFSLPSVSDSPALGSVSLPESVSERTVSRATGFVSSDSSCSSAAHWARRRLKPILRLSGSTFRIFTSTSSPSLTMSCGLSILWSASSEICKSPSSSGSSSTNAPKLVIFVILPLMIWPGMYFSGIARNHGSSVICLTPREIRCFSGSTSRTTHFISSPF